MNSIIIDCDQCIMRATSACGDCVVTHVCESADDATAHGPDLAGAHSAVVFDLAEQRAVRWFAEAGMVPTLRHRAASGS